MRCFLKGYKEFKGGGKMDRRTRLSMSMSMKTSMRKRVVIGAFVFVVDDGKSASEGKIASGGDNGVGVGGIHGWS